MLGIPEVSRHISAKDDMFSGDATHYFAVGESALESIELALRAARKDKAAVRKILDLPCGYGRVLRHIRAAFPETEITACDLDKDAVDFCATTFQAIPVYSESHPGQIRITGSYDLIWCGSLLTHLDETRSMDFLRFFHSLLGEYGILVFTVHGPSSAYAVRGGHLTYQLDEAGIDRLMKTYADQGYGYADYPWESEYGISLCTPSFMTKQIEKLPELRLLIYTEMGWANHHDVIACVHEPLEARLRRAL